ncbi:tRNA pseudouridine(38-40) synthase TruA [Aminivibrio sp.]
MEESLESIFGHRIVVTAAGRTDAGVHARGQVISFDLPREWHPERLLLAVNSYLPRDIRIMKAARMPEDFDARRSAHWREYRYLIWHGNALSPFRGPTGGQVFLGYGRGAEGLCLYEGTHDFRAFCKTAECPADSVRTVLRASLRTRRNLTLFTVRGKSFLTNMVRIMIGNLQAVGRGKPTPERSPPSSGESADSPSSRPLPKGSISGGRDTATVIPGSESGVQDRRIW